MKLDAPSFIVGFNDIKKKELWINSLKCGYSGTGARATFDILTNFFKISFPNIDSIIINNDVAEFYKEDNAWRCRTISNNLETYIRFSQIYI